MDRVIDTVEYLDWQLNRFLRWDPSCAVSLCTFRGHQNVVYHATFSPHIPGCIASVSGDETVRVWNVSSPDTSCVSIQRAHHSEILHCDWNKYNQNCFVTAGVDGLVRGWDLRNPRKFVFELRGHEYAVRRVKCSPHRESVIATVSYDFTTRIWDLSCSVDNSVCRFDAHTEFVYGLDFNLHVEGQVVDCAFDEHFHIYDIIGS